MTTLTLAVAILLLIATLYGSAAQTVTTQPICTLASGSTSYNLKTPPLGTQTNGITALPNGFVTAYINFCNPVAKCATPTATPYACLIDGGGKVQPLCMVQPMGGFIDARYPQLGANYSCPAVVASASSASYQLHGVITSASNWTRTHTGTLSLSQSTMSVRHS